MTAVWRSKFIFWRPASFTLLLHFWLVALLTVNWFQRSDTVVRPRMEPRFVEARLVDAASLQPQKKTVAKPPQRRAPARSKPVATATSAVKPKQSASKPAPPAVAPAPAAETGPSEQELAARARQELNRALAAEDVLQAQASDLEIAQSYIALISRSVEINWSRPPSARNGMEAELVIHLIPTGEVVSVTVVRGSGQQAFDRSAVNAVQKAQRFPELQQMPPRIFEQNFRQFRLLFKPEDLRR